MSWAAVAVGVGSAVVGAYSANRSASAARRASQGAGQVDITRTTDPGLGSGQIRQDIYNRAGQTALNQGPGFDAWNAGRGGLSGAAAQAPAPGGGQRAKPPAGMRYNARGQLKPIRNQGGGGNGAGGGGGAQTPAFNGVSQQTNTVRDAMIGQAQQGNPLYGTAQDFVGDTLEGNDRNAYRSETFDALRDVDDPDLARLKQYLFSQLEDPNAGGFGGGGGGNRTYYVNSNYAAGPGGGTGGGEGPVGAAGYIKKMLDEGYGDNPFLDQSIQDALDDSQRAFNRDVIPGLNSEYAGSGRFGGGMYAQALARSGEEQIRGLAKESNTRRAGDYNDWQARRMQALGYGTEMDMNAADNATALASRGGGGGGGGGSDQQTLALQRQGMLLNALGGAVGEGVGLKQFGLGGMGDLAKSFSGDQQFALGSVPDVTGLSLRDWGAAGGLSLGADQNQGQYDLGLRDVAARNRATGVNASIARQQMNLANRQFDFDVFRDERGYPLQSLGGAADIVNAMTGGYGQTREYGSDRRAQSPYLGDTAGQTISGGLGAGLMGYQLASAYGGRGGGGSNVGLATGSTPYGGGSTGYYLDFRG